MSNSTVDDSQITGAFLKIPCNKQVLQQVNECLAKINSGNHYPTQISNRDIVSIVIATINNIPGYHAQDNSYTGAKYAASIVVSKDNK